MRREAKALLTLPRRRTMARDPAGRLSRLDGQQQSSLGCQRPSSRRGCVRRRCRIGAVHLMATAASTDWPHFVALGIVHISKSDTFRAL